jgi:hypothetical protein
MVEVPVWLTATGLAVTALVTIVAALLGNRYTQLLDIRGSHHNDLSREVIQPWRKHIQATSRIEVKEKPLLSVSPAYDPGSPWRAQVSGDKLKDAPLPRNTPLWARTREHWPSLHEFWQELEADMDAEQDAAIRVAEGVEARLLEYASRLEGIKWLWDQQNLPAHGRRIQVAFFISWLYDWHFSPLPRKIEVSCKNRSDGTSSVLLFTGEIATGPPAAGVALCEALTGITESTEIRALLEEALEASKKVGRKQKQLLAALDSVEYDRNLRGQCAYCPRLPRLVRVFGKIIG